MARLTLSQIALRGMLRLVAGVLVAASVVALRNAAASQGRRAPTVFYLDLTADAAIDVLKGPPATAGMRSGYVVLAPGGAVGAHSTEGNEEVVVYAGTGELRYTGRPALALRAGAVAYNPARTTHDVVNTGKVPLRYLYVVSPAETKR